MSEFLAYLALLCTLLAKTEPFTAYCQIWHDGHARRGHVSTSMPLSRRGHLHHCWVAQAMLDVPHRSVRGVVAQITLSVSRWPGQAPSVALWPGQALPIALCPRRELWRPRGASPGLSLLEQALSMARWPECHLPCCTVSQTSLIRPRGCISG